MSEQIKNGGQAFPQLKQDQWGNFHEKDGMTMLDYFAAKAMQGFCGSGHAIPTRIEHYAEDAYKMADAMLAERERHSTPTEQDGVLDDMRAYFPKAETLHDCYRGIEALERQRDELLATLIGVAGCFEAYCGDNDHCRKVIKDAKEIAAKIKGGAA